VVIPFDDEDDAVRIANDSAFGLGGSIFTSDPDRAEQFARRIETGSVGINFYGSNLAAPFGGWKDSGLGMEYGPEAIGAYVRMKSIHREG
jgi:acyl-CoA reductase-like NAD-dependent aldehyde dehydrogenase